MEQIKEKEKMVRQRRGFIAHKEKYKIEIKYSEKAEKKELIKFTVKKGTAFEMSIRELVDLVALHFNKKMIAPMFVESNTVHMTEVTRVLKGVVTQDMKVGDEINIPYKHFIPYAFAVCEEAMNLCKVEGRPIREYVISEEDFELAKKSVDQKVVDFTNLVYKPILDKINPPKDPMLLPEGDNEIKN